RLYAVECAPTPSGTLADHRLRAPPSEMPEVLATVLDEATRSGTTPTPVPDGLAHALGRRRGATPHQPWVQPAARALAAHGGRSAVIVGERQPAAVHAMAHALNAALGNVGRTVRYLDAPALEPADTEAGLAP